MIRVMLEGEKFIICGFKRVIFKESARIRRF